MSYHTPIFVRPARAQEMIGISSSTFYRWAAAGHITIHKRGGASFVKVSEIVKYITDGESDPEKPA